MINDAILNYELKIFLGIVMIYFYSFYYTNWILPKNLHNLKKDN